MAVYVTMTRIDGASTELGFELKDGTVRVWSESQEETFSYDYPITFEPVFAKIAEIMRRLAVEEGVRASDFEKLDDLKDKGKR